jgi:DNA polymerase-3 subunit beta
MQVNTKQFIKELEWTARFVETKSTIPILNTVLFRKRGDALQLIATDLEVGGATSIAIDEDAPDFELCVPVKSLLKYLKRVDDSSLTLVPDVCVAAMIGPHVEGCAGQGTPDCCTEPFFIAGRLGIEHGQGGAVTLDGLNPSGFPVLPIAPPAAVAIGGLSKSIPRALIAISTEESRFTLCGALLDVDARGAARFVSTDGHRLSLVETNIEGRPPAEPLRVLIPKTALAEVLRLGDSALVSTDEHHVYFAVGDRTVTARKMAGNFPDWERVMPSDLKFSVTGPAAQLRNVVDRVAVLADERSHTVEVCVNGAMKITARQHEQSATGEIPVAGPHFVTPYVGGFNATYILDFLKALDAPEFRFRFFSPKNAAEFDADGWRYVLMPMRLGSDGENPVAEGEFEPVPSVVEALDAHTPCAPVPVAPPVRVASLPRAKPSDALRNSALRLKTEGVALGQIAKQLGAPQSSVWRWVHAAARA